MFKTLIVVDKENSELSKDFPELISFEEYLRDYPKRNEPQTRLINLCDTQQYLSKGYYCSLLAEARKHAALPSVKTINDIRQDTALQQFFAINIHKSNPLFTKQQTHWIYFGKTQVNEFSDIATSLFKRYPCPIMKLDCKHDEKAELVIELQRCSPSQLPPAERVIFIECMKSFTQKVWRVNSRPKNFRWEMAILVNPKEKVPPSNKEAITRFVKAAAKLSIKAEVLSYSEISNINNFDALFIRETTAIDHYTYRLASEAESNNVIVIDDPTSILRCCNKVFLHDAFSYQGVPSLKTEVVSDCSEETLEKLANHIGFPMILKMPEGSFSHGVFKIQSAQELKERLVNMFKESALILAQEYFFTEYDWRIGVLNGRAIYACQYKMARNHWQIYNHDSKRFFSGGFETMPTFEVPQAVLKAAIKACSVVGLGLYGVDIKQKDQQAFVLEVNDNPNIDYKIEDVYLGNELYMQVMSEFQRRLEERGKN